jgi:hypothetical protein
MHNELLVMLLVGGALFAGARMVRALPDRDVALAQTRRLLRGLMRGATRAD